MGGLLNLARPWPNPGPRGGAVRPPDRPSGPPRPGLLRQQHRAGQGHPTGALAILTLAATLAHILARLEWADPWNEQAGDIIWSIADAIYGELEDGERHDRRTLTQRVVNHLDANRSTVENVINELARYGAIDRPGRHTIRLTPLGAQWRNQR